MRIGFFEMEGWEEAIVRKELVGHELYFSKETIDEDTLPEVHDFDIISIFVDSDITPKVLDHFPNVKLITTNSTGFDHIDIEACKARGITVTFVPGYGNNTVAEFAMGLLLNLTRKIYLAIYQVEERDDFSLSNLRGIDLKGKTMGILGTGRIGKEMVKIAKGFGMNVIAYDMYPDTAAAQELGFSYKTLEEVLGNSDCISIHCPLNDSTHHLISMKNVNLIKRGAYLVNTARGPIIETDAIVYALKEGILAGAGLDVLEEEEETKNELKFLSRSGSHEEAFKIIVENHVLMEMPNALVTPHNAFNSQEALMRILDTTMKNIKGFVAGTLDPKNVVKA